jgi:uncharacterized membrane protein
MVKRLTKFLLVFSLLVGILPARDAYGQGQAQTLAQSPTQPAQVQIIEQSADGLLLRVTVSDYDLTEVTQDGTRYETLSLPEAGKTTQAGLPQLPVVNAFFGVPPDVELVVQVMNATSQVLPVHAFLLPAPVPLPVTDEFSAGTFAYQPDAVAYASDQNYPAVMGEIADDGWLRDQRVARLAVYPFQYRAASGHLTWNSEILVAVRFVRTQVPQAFEPIGAAATDSPFEPLLQRSLLNYEQARQWRAIPSAESVPLSANGSQALSTRYKIVVDTDGLYHLTYTDTMTAGFSATDPRNWQLTNLGSTVAITVTGQEDGHFDLGDEVLFYGERFRGARYAARYPDEASIFWLLDNCHRTACAPQISNFRRDVGLQMEKYTFENVYWLEVMAARGARMPLADGTPTGLTPATYYTTTVRAETQFRWFGYPIIDTEDWFWQQGTRSATDTQPVTLTNAITLDAVANVPISATVRGAYVALSSSNSIYPDHHSRISFNSPPFVVQDIWWDDIGRQAFAANLPVSKLQAGTNNLYLTIYPVAGAVQDMYFDWYEVDYARRFVPVNDALPFRGSQAGRQAFQAGGFHSNRIWALDVTSPLTPTFISNAAVVPSGGGTYTATLEAANGLGRQFILAAQPGLKTPKKISAYTPTDLYAATNGADYIIIADPLYNTPAQQLATYRAGQGLRSVVVNINDVYNLFGDGIYNPLAIKNFLRYAYTHWQAPAPRYVVLVGDGHFDFHLYRASPTQAQTMPPYMIFTDSWQGDVDSANQLVTLVGKDILPDMLVGRMVVADASQMQAVVNKIITYEAQAAQPWQQRLMFLADDVPDVAGDFVAQSDELINNHIPDSYTVQRLYLNNYVPPSAITTDFRDSLNNQGAFFVNYMGHGAITSWASPTIFQSGNVSSLTNASMLPITLDMTCLTGFWFHILGNHNSLAMGMQRHPTGGAIASFAPTSRGVSTGHDTLARGFYDAVFQDEVRTLGEATLGGQLNVFVSGYDYDLINTFVLFGDPALKLPVPLHQPDVSTTDAQNETVPGKTVTYALTVRNNGTVTDTFTLSTQGNAWPVQFSQSSIGPLAPGAQAQVTVSVQIPLNAADNSTDTANIIVTSQGNTHKSDTQALITTANIIPGIQVSPASAVKTGKPGETVAYTLFITNTGNFTDTFTVVISSPWNVALLPPAPVGPLAPGQGRTVTAAVTIPSTATNYAENWASISFSSQSHPLTSAATTLQTIVSVIAGAATSPGSAAKSGLPGEIIAYSLSITNTGEYTDTYTVAINSPWAAMLTPPAPIGPIAPGQGRTLTLNVSIPLTATNGSFSVAAITFRSQVDATISATSNFLSSVNIPTEIVIAPASAAQDGVPGQIVIYTLQVTNAGALADTFSVETNSPWPATLTPTGPFGPIPPGESRSITLRVSIPVAAANGSASTTSLTFRSQNNPGTTATATYLTNVRILAGVQVSPVAAAQKGKPGETIAYTLQITNTGNYTDTYTVAVNSLWANSLWAVTLTQPAPVGPLAPGQSRILTVNVLIPPAATNGNSSTASLTFRSKITPSAMATANYLTTVHILAGLQVTPITDTKTGKSGETITYALTITNTGDFTDTFTITSASDWVVNLAPTSVGPLGIGASATLSVRVTIPTTALNGQSAATTVTLRSQNVSSVSASAVLSTNVMNTRKIYLPVILR